MDKKFDTKIETTRNWVDISFKMGGNAWIGFSVERKDLDKTIAAMEEMAAKLKALKE